MLLDQYDLLQYGDDHRHTVDQELQGEPVTSVESACLLTCVTRSRGVTGP